MLQPGQRLTLSHRSGIALTFSGREHHRLAIAAFTADGRAIPFQQGQAGNWTLDDVASLGTEADIVAYITNDTQGGFVSGAYPLTGTIGSETYRFPDAQQQLAAIILGQVYTRAKELRLKISNEGFTFGISAYLRARRFTGLSVPYRISARSDRSEGYNPGHDNANEPWPPTTKPSPDGPAEQVLATGSGAVVGHRLVITNAHVIDGGRDFQIGRTRERLTVLAVDTLHDLALLEGPVSGEPLPIRIGAPVWLGESVLASGYPLMDVLGADLKVTTGNVSGLTGGQGDISRFQFTAPIGSGSSGGAIVDDAGNLVGITCASLAHSNMRERGSLSENVNFAVRASLAHEMIAAAGKPLPASLLHPAGNRRDIVNRLRDSVVSIIVLG